MTKKQKTTKIEIRYSHNGGGKEDDMQVYGITRKVRELADAARSAGKRWDHALWQVDEKTIVLVLVEIVEEIFGVYLGWVEFANDDERNLAVKTLRREVGKWVKEHRFQPQPVKQLEEVKR
jgi:hypothetical protein